MCFTFFDKIHEAMIRDLKKATTTFFSAYNVRRVNTFDIDGVIFISQEVGGIYPGPNDIIITGRSIDEKPETERMLKVRGIHNEVYYNPIPFEQKTRVSSGCHKGAVINKLINDGYQIGFHIEDDEVQAAEIKKLCPSVPVIMVVHNLTTKENVRHKEY